MPAAELTSTLGPDTVNCLAMMFEREAPLSWYEPVPPLTPMPVVFAPPVRFTLPLPAEAETVP